MPATACSLYFSLTKPSVKSASSRIVVACSRVSGLRGGQVQEWLGHGGQLAAAGHGHGDGLALPQAGGGLGVLAGDGARRPAAGALADERDVEAEVLEHAGGAGHGLPFQLGHVVLGPGQHVGAVGPGRHGQQPDHHQQADQHLAATPPAVPRGPLGLAPVPAPGPAGGGGVGDLELPVVLGLGRDRRRLGEHRRVPVEFDVDVGQHDGPRQRERVGRVQLRGGVQEQCGEASGVRPLVGIQRPGRLQGRPQHAQSLGHRDGIGHPGHQRADGRVDGERHLAGHGFDEHEGQRVHVAAPGQRAALGLLGRGVAGGAQHGAGGLGDGGVGQCPGEAEVGDAQALVVAEQQVGGLQVPVDQALAVGVVQTLGGLEPDERRLRQAQPSAPVEHGPQGTAADELGDEERHLLVAPVVDGQQVGVVEAGRDLCLGVEPADEAVVVGVGLVQQLDGDPAPEPGVLGQVDLRRGPRPDGRQEAVAAREDPTDLVVHARQGHAPRVGGRPRRKGVLGVPGAKLSPCHRCRAGS